MSFSFGHPCSASLSIGQQLYIFTHPGHIPGVPQNSPTIIVHRYSRDRFMNFVLE